MRSMYSFLGLFAPNFKILLAILVTVNLVLSEDCGQEELNQCAKPLQVLSSTAELSFVTKKSELEQLCPDLHAGLRCIHSYTRRCMSQKQRSHFNQLYHGTNTVISELCEDGPYQDEFLRHAPCMHRVQREYERCARRYQETMSQLGKPKNVTSNGRSEQLTTSSDGHMSEKLLEDSDGYQEYQQLMRKQQLLRQRQMEEQRRRQLALQGQMSPQEEQETEEQLRTVCCSFQEYIRCSQYAVRCECGEDAAEFTKGFLDKMSTSLIKLHCANYGENSGRCLGFSSADSIIRQSCYFLVSVVAALLLTS